ncbi:hypothetical protein KAFR_0C06260 [Kazachstania africana CBS 2517]|uniref:DUF3533 domain-containing protein n=1 Tax=Kazachstania africana (strain ATCC 22294 / BCRC 22015 / CBS 2517 / CECT 1963 / NBRC 1671 / NRRL Y-8276) TaxID=1071382 RepID=H2ATC1_KAZAF|nr:hypothetical protein KAFR_0C06260 [Kazachstania africana CBS 2517]CCF57621.1 hypothetical protein KAFR_0C06260 [Kazachstania africana CBS 2517]
MVEPTVDPGSSESSLSDLHSSRSSSTSVHSFEPESLADLRTYNSRVEDRSNVYPQVETEMLGRIMTSSNVAYQENSDNNLRRKSIIAPTTSAGSSASTAQSDKNYLQSILSSTFGNGAIQEEQGLSRRPSDARSELSIVRTITNKLIPLEAKQTNFFSKRIKDERKWVILQFLGTNLILICVILVIFNLFWGVVYNTNYYFHKVNHLVVIQDDSLSNDSPVASMTAILPSLIQALPGNWHVYNTTEFQEKFHVTTTQEINAKVTGLIYHEDFFVSLNVFPNVTRSLYNSLTSSSSNIFQPSAFFEVTYETGRDPTNLKNWILPVMEELEMVYQQYYTSTYFPQFIDNITTAPLTATQLNMTRITSAGEFAFTYVDYRQFYSRTLLCTTQFGPIYTLLLTVFQFMIFGPVHAEMAKVLKPRHTIIYRYAITSLTCFILSLFVCTVSAIYQVDFTLAFGKAGFVIYWMSNWLFMMAAAGTNENVLSIIFLLKPQFAGIWIFSFIVINLAPTIFSLALSNNFYRYGYMMPLHNAVDIFRVIFLNTSRVKMGRNYGVLAAWVVINMALCPFVIRFVAKTAQKRALAAMESTDSSPTKDSVESVDTGSNISTTTDASPNRSASIYSATSLSTSTSCSDRSTSDVRSQSYQSP